jgi:peptidyl-dipeptidase Dcp
MTIGIASALTMQFSACKEAQHENPLLAESQLPYGAPDFSKIQVTDYLPAFEAAIQDKRDNIQKIVDCPDSATFENTILPYEESGRLLDRVGRVFFALVEADKTPELGELEKKIQPMLTDLENEIMFNKPLFERIRQVYDNFQQSHQSPLPSGGVGGGPEDQKLLEETYKEFVRKGALLPDDKMERMKQINKRIADLQTEWGDMLPNATNDAVVWVDSEADLAGLSEADMAQCMKDAESRGKKAPYAIVIANTTQQQILASLDNRELRRKVYEASIHRADGTGKYNTYPLVCEIAKLRAEQAEIMGYPNYAAYSLEKTMAKTPENVYAFLKSLIAQYTPKADAETKAIEAFAAAVPDASPSGATAPSFSLQPYDRFYYSAKMKKQLLNFSDDEVKPYFNVDSVLLNGVFYAAGRAYGLTFKERKDIPLYHPDMRAFEVFDRDGKPKALFYTDYYRRPTKRGGAWMDGFQKQSRQWNQQPIIFNVCNNAKAPEGKPSLLTWDEVTTMFHEFGHALHGILSDCQYNRLSGTSVARDFVEMPSQFNESFAAIPEVFDHYARHCETGEPMPADLKERMLKSINFQTAYALGENLAATCVDLAWHMLAAKDVPTPEQAADFETAALRQVGLLNEQIPPRYHTSYFNHVFGGGYAAGYYSYLWTEVLAVNIADVFAQRGPLKPETGRDFCDKILSRGNTGDLMQMFTDFTGMQQPDASSLLKARGL